MNTHPTHTIKKACLLEKNVRMCQNHLLFETARKRQSIKLATVGGGEIELLGADIPSYDAIFVVVILCGFTEEFGDLFDGAAAGGSVLIGGSLFCDEVYSDNIRAGNIDTELAGIVEIHSLECEYIGCFLAAPLQRIDRRMSIEKNLAGSHAGPQTVQVDRLWRLRGSDEWEQKYAKK